MDAETVLAGYWPGVAVGSRISPFVPEDSLSGAAFWRVTGPAGAYCLRRWPDAAAELGRVDEVHRALQHVAARLPGVAPEPVRSAGGETVLRLASGCWELTRWVAGEADYHAAPSAEKRRSAARLLARIHRAMEGQPVPQWAGLGSPGLERRRERLRAAAADARLPAGVRADGVASRLSEELQRNLSGALASVEAALNRPLPLQWCVRDARAEHVLFQGQEAVGLVDFGAVGIDSVAADLARLLRGLGGSDGKAWRECLDAYGEIRPLSDAETGAIAAYDLGGLAAAAVNWLGWQVGDRAEAQEPDAAAARMAWLADQLAGMPPHPLD
ncbi:MAG: phosphotransferase [Planctomycetota bacterium]